MLILTASPSRYPASKQKYGIRKSPDVILLSSLFSKSGAAYLQHYPQEL